MNNQIFHEKQRFSQIWIWLLLLIIGFFAYKPLYFAISTNGNLSTDQWMGIIILTLVMAFFMLVSLETKLDQNGIYVKFFPIHLKPKFYSWDSISHIEVRKYSPLMEYGGWGIRFGKNGTAYNVKGNKGLQIFLKNGDGILIGTQKEEELKHAIQEIQTKI